MTIVRWVRRTRPPRAFFLIAIQHPPVLVITGNTCHSTSQFVAPRQSTLFSSGISDLYKAVHSLQRPAPSPDQTTEMSVVSLLGVSIQNNPASFTDSYLFDITFECLETLKQGTRTQQANTWTRLLINAQTLNGSSPMSDLLLLQSMIKNLTPSLSDLFLSVSTGSPSKPTLLT